MKEQIKRCPSMPAKQAQSENSSAFKNWISPELLKRMSLAIASVYSKFDKKEFLTVASALEKFELKGRVQLIRSQLHQQLPSDYPKALEILLKSLGANKLHGFDLWPYTDFIQTYGLEHEELSLRALEKITELFTGEFAVRPFLRQDSKKTLQFLLQKTQSKNVHARRWASEGSRPRLPWGERLHEFVKKPQLTLPILEKLKFDEELYVRKSVANHLNDIAKDHPQLVIDTLAKWQKQAGTHHAEKINWIIHRALRTLIKNGNPKALALIGVNAKTAVALDKIQLNKKKFKVGDKLEFEFTLKSLSKKSQKIVLDYVVHFAKARGKTAPKVFKLKTLQLAPGAKVQVKKAHSLKKITTRTYYSGGHCIEIQVNGKIYQKCDWILEA